MFFSFLFFSFLLSKRGERKEKEPNKEKEKEEEFGCEAANLDVFFFLDFGHFLVLLET